MWFSTVSCMVLLLSVWQQADAQINQCTGGVVALDQGSCAEGWNQVGNYCYQVVREAVDFNTAQQGCDDRGGRLAWIESVTDMCSLGQFLDTVVGSPRDTFFWIGGRTGPDRQFKWIDSDGTDGPLVAGELWHMNQPDNWGNAEDHIDFVFFNGAGYWGLNDRDPGAQSQYLCQSAPASVSLSNAMPPQECIGGTVDLSQSLCANGWYQIGESCYQVVMENTGYEGAKQGCIARGGRLAWVETRETMCGLADYLETVAGANRASFVVYYVGGWRMGPGTSAAAPFNWIENDGTPGPALDPMFWLAGEPNINEEDNVMLGSFTPNGPYGLLDAPANFNSPYLCEMTTEDAYENRECVGSIGDLDQGICEAGWYQVGESCYQVVMENTGFEGAKQGCIERGSRVAWVETRDDMCGLADLLETTAGTNRANFVLYYVGGWRMGPGTTTSAPFSWIENDGTPGPALNPRFWLAGEPNINEEDNVMIGSFTRGGPYGLLDAPAEYNSPYLCQITGEEIARRAAEEAARIAAEEEAARLAAEQAAAEEAARIAAEEEAARIAAEEEAARLAAEEAARIAAEEEAARQAAEQAAAEEAARIAAEEEAARLAAEEEAARFAAEEADRIAAEQEAARLAAEEEASQEGALDLGPYYVVTASGEAGRLGKEYPPEILDEEGRPRLFAIDGVSIPNFNGVPNRGFNIVCLDRATGNVLAEHNFDTWIDKINHNSDNANALAELISDLFSRFNNENGENRDIILLIGVSDAGNNCRGRCLELLSSVLNTEIQTIKYGESFAAIAYIGNNPNCVPEPLENSEEAGLLYARSGRFTVSSRQDEHGNDLWAPYVTVSARVYRDC